MDDLYSHMGTELKLLFQDLFDPQKRRSVRIQMGAILVTSRQIGGAVAKEAQKLIREIDRFLNQPDDPALLNQIKEHALKLKQETREI